MHTILKKLAGFCRVCAKIWQPQSPFNWGRRLNLPDLPVNKGGQARRKPRQLFFGTGYSGVWRHLYQNCPEDQ